MSATYSTGPRDKEWLFPTVQEQQPSPMVATRPYSTMAAKPEAAPTAPPQLPSSTPTSDGSNEYTFDPATGKWTYKTATPKKYNISDLINNAMSTIGDYASANEAVTSNQQKQDVAGWRAMGQRYQLNPESPVRPDLGSYMQNYPSKLESIQQGAAFNKTDALGYIFNTPMAAHKAYQKGKEHEDLMDWASYVSSRGVEGGLGMGGGIGGLLSSFGAGAGSGGTAIEKGVSATTGSSGASGSSGMSIGGWGIVAGAVIGVIQGIMEWNSAAEQDKKAAEQAKAEYLAAVKEWEMNQAKARINNRLTLAENQRQQQARLQAQQQQSAVSKKQMYMNLISNAMGGGSNYRAPRIGG